MYLLVDVGNSNIVFGVCKDKKIVYSFRMKTLTNRSSDEFVILFKSMLGDYQFDGVLISSVVPVVTSMLVKMFKSYYNINALILGPGIKTGVMIKADNPREVGADLICDVAGASLYHKESIVIDLGTATKYIYQKDNTFMGLSIAPGVSISMQALVNKAALLPEFELQTPKTVLCNNTINCMQSGVIYGAASQVDSMIDRIKEEIKKPDIAVIATGGLASVIVPLCRHNIIVDKDLVLEGLMNIYLKNLK
ncbi:MAG: type III pantothenate kinase [Acholeplasmatales bacterium]|nr:type III pantothenate kinase [Acholeplasmatales bacterium]